jgi:hypothetical protein
MVIHWIDSAISITVEWKVSGVVKLPLGLLYILSGRGPKGKIFLGNFYLRLLTS